MTLDPDRLDPDLKVLADPKRARIVEFLLDPDLSCCSRDDGICACDVEAFLGLSQPTVSHHMRALVDAGFVRAERRGRWVYYELEPARFRDAAARLHAFAEAAEQAAPATTVLPATTVASR